MRDALNKTGRKMWYAIHAGNCEDWSQPVNCVNGSVANMWRTGGDLSSSSFDMWTNRKYRKHCVLGAACASSHLCCRRLGPGNSTSAACACWPRLIPKPRFPRSRLQPSKSEGSHTVSCGAAQHVYDVGSSTWAFDSLG